MNLTRVPGFATLERAHKSAETTLFLAVPVNIGALKAAAEAALGEKVAKWRAYIDDIACDKRKGPWVECNGAIVTAEMVRSGPVDIGVENGRLQLIVTVKYDIAARGHGWASYLTESKSGSVEVRIPIDAVLGAGYRLDMRIASDPVWSEKAISVLRGKISLGQSGNPKLKSDLAASGESLRKAMTDQPVKAETARAWRALHGPIALMQSPDLWLRGEPIRVFGGGFAEEAGAVVYRIGIGMKVAIGQGQRPMPAVLKPLPDPSPRGEATGATRLLFPVDVSAQSLLVALRQALPQGEVIETKADNKAVALKVAMREVALQPAKDSLAVALKLDIIEPRRFQGYTGRAPKALSIPAPPSVVALPPSPTTTERHARIQGGEQEPPRAARRGDARVRRRALPLRQPRQAGGGRHLDERRRSVVQQQPVRLHRAAERVVHGGGRTPRPLPEGRGHGRQRPLAAVRHRDLHDRVVGSASPPSRVAIAAATADRVERAAERVGRDQHPHQRFERLLAPLQVGGDGLASAGARRRPPRAPPG